MKRPQALANSIYIKDMDERRIMSRPKKMEANPTHNLPENIEKALTLLKKALGDQWVSADDGITVGYARDQSMKPANYPDIVVLPGSVDDVAKVFQIASECLVDVMPYGTGCNTFGICIPPYGGIILDGRRMDKILAIDKDKQYATIEVGVNYCMLQAEAQKIGMRVTNPSAPATVSVVSNHLFCNINTMSSKFGFGMDNVLEAEIVLPSGEILLVGPHAHGMDPVQVPGFGPDMSSLLRYSAGTMGYVTKMTIRLYPEPPLMKAIYPGYPDEDLKDLIEALYRLAQDNQAHELAHLQNSFYSIFIGNNNKETESFMNQIPRNNLWAYFGGITEEELEIKLAYARQQVQEVSDKYFFIDPESMKGIMDGRVNLARWNKFFRETVRVQRVRGSFIIGALVYNMDGLYEAEKAMREAVTDQMGTANDILRQDDPSTYFQPYHMGRMCYMEFDLYTNQDDKDDIIRSYIAYFRAMGIGFGSGAVFCLGIMPMLIGIPGLSTLVPMTTEERKSIVDLNVALKKDLDPRNVVNRRWEYDTGASNKFLLF